MKNIIFVGGVHGVGKGKICSELKLKTKLIHLTASEVLKWRDISDKNNKLVENISRTQDLLVDNLRKIIKENNTYLLDGHYCLFDKNGNINRIPFKTFELLNPLKLIFIYEDSKIIRERLENRDRVKYNIEKIDFFQNMEKQYSYELSKIMKIPLIEIQSSNYNQEILIKFINENTSRH
ncbi:TPA: ATP-binding protein [Elizabethkingia anophelis]